MCLLENLKCDSLEILSSHYPHPIPPFLEFYSKFQISYPQHAFLKHCGPDRLLNQAEFVSHTEKIRLRTTFFLQ